MASPRFLLLLVCVFASPAAAQDPSTEGRWVAVVRPGLEDALAPLIAHRRTLGHETVVVPNPAQIASKGRPRYVLLVGDVATTDENPPWALPSVERALYRWRNVQPKTFPSDAAYGDLDGDGVPEVPVGRIPARTPGEVERVVAKILAFERRPVRLSDLRLVAWGGAPGYGGAIDRSATKLFADTIRKSAPPWADLWMISAAIDQPLCGWPADQPRLFNESLRRGGLLSAICAHAGPRHVFSMKHEGQRITYGARHVLALSGKEPLAPLVLLACDAGRFHEERACLAEMLLTLPGGPVSTIAATTESHPLTNYYTGRCLLRALSGESVGCIGDAFLSAQRAALTDRNLLIEFALKDAEGKLEAHIDVTKLRRDQALMYALLGDPATRLKLPRPLEISTQTQDGEWSWSATVPKGTRAIHVGFRPRPQPRQKRGPPANAVAAQIRFDAANTALAHSEQPFKRTEDRIHGTVGERGHLRVVVETKDALHVGFRVLK
ncbi:MAG: hypothetical protein CMJ83_03740 [Planctomycetes bacterium]|nr:hypothetical protein [Planctomycetota bacterium]